MKLVAATDRRLDDVNVGGGEITGRVVIAWPNLKMPKEGAEALVTLLRRSNVSSSQGSTFARGNESVENVPALRLVQVENELLELKKKEKKAGRETPQ